MRRISEVLGWMGFFGLCAVWYWVLKPETIWQWVGAGLGIVVSFLLLVMIYENIGYRLRSARDIRLRKDNLIRVARLHLGVLQETLQSGSLQHLSRRFAATAINEIAATAPAAAEAVAAGWFPDHGAAEVMTHMFTADVTLTSVARQVGDRTVSVELKLELEGDLPVSSVKIALVGRGTADLEDSEAVGGPHTDGAAAMETTVEPVVGADGGNDGGTDD